MAKRNPLMEPPFDSNPGACCPQHCSSWKWRCGQFQAISATKKIRTRSPLSKFNLLSSTPELIDKLSLIPLQTSWLKLLNPIKVSYLLPELLACQTPPSPPSRQRPIPGHMAPLFGSVHTSGKTQWGCVAILRKAVILKELPYIYAYIVAKGFCSRDQRVTFRHFQTRRMQSSLKQHSGAAATFKLKNRTPASKRLT